MFNSINDWLDSLALWQLLLMGFGVFLTVGIISYFYPKFNELPSYKTTRKRFKEMGDPASLNYEEVIEKVGEPNSITTDGNMKICQWLKANPLGGTHMVLAFDEQNRCKGIIHKMKFDILKGG